MSLQCYSLFLNIFIFHTYTVTLVTIDSSQITTLFSFVLIKCRYVPTFKNCDCKTSFLITLPQNVPLHNATLASIHTPILVILFFSIFHTLEISKLNCNFANPALLPPKI